MPPQKLTAARVIEGAVDLGIAESRARQLVAQFILIGAGFLVRIDIRFEQIHQYIEYAFFHCLDYSRCDFPRMAACCYWSDGCVFE